MIAITIYCCGCEKKVTANLVDGSEIYPHRHDLHKLPFWKCRTCENYVGCHHKTRNRTEPLGCIPTPEIRKARRKIHAVVDPLWRTGPWSRRYLYAEIGERLGRKYHTANIRSVEEAMQVLSVAENLSCRPPTTEDDE